MEVTTTPIEGLLILKPQVFPDNRGYFMESYNKSTFEAAAQLTCEFVQDNESYSELNVIRGLHFQIPPFQQGKLVRVSKGKVLDVAVDLRIDSPTFGQHQAIELSDSNKLQFWIPPGFAHGFRSLEQGSIVCYKCTQVYHGSSERALKWDDPELGINWGDENALISDKDNNAPAWADIELPENWEL